MRGAFCVVSEDAARCRDLDAEYELEATQSLYISGVYMSRPRVGRDIGVIVEKHRQPTSQPVKEAADLPLKEFDDITYVRDGQWGDDRGMHAGLDRALEIIDSFCGRAARHSCPGLDRGQLPSCQVIIDPGYFIGLDSYKLLPFSIGDPVPLAVGTCGENDVRPEAILRIEAKDAALFGFDYMSQAV